MTNAEVLFFAMEPWGATPPTRTLLTSYLPMLQSLTRRHALASHQTNKLTNTRLRKINSSSTDRTTSIYIAISLVHTAIESNKLELSDKYSAQRNWFAGAQSGLEADNRYQPQLVSVHEERPGKSLNFSASPQCRPWHFLSTEISNRNAADCAEWPSWASYTPRASTSNY